ncbi:hypothetical protein [Dactylosporangium sp. NPDC005555]|uniref:hypothetical protein n=1 Tax=Dactylosporangium sp. NPDC005555 TaxID=3154889 RepID=UPI0033B140F0
MNRLSRALAALLVTTGLAVGAAAPAHAATDLPYPTKIMRVAGGDWADGTGVRAMKNAAGQQIGWYEMWVDYWHMSAYSVEVTICVWDTLGNGRGVIARVMAKHGTNSSTEIDRGKFKDGGCVTVYEDFSHPIWGVDVDHGETWAGTPYQYTGKYDRYVVFNPTKPSVPGFR